MATTTICASRPSGSRGPRSSGSAALHLGALLAFVPGYFSWSGLALCFFLHWLTGGIGICMTYHRLLTHRSFALRPSVARICLDDHRHAAPRKAARSAGWPTIASTTPISDEEDDTHTPHEGFFWAHMYWWMIGRRRLGAHARVLSEVGPDLYKDPVHRWLEQYHFIFPILLFVALYAVGGMSWLVWGGFVRTVFVLHSTWLVNSASHVWGYRSHPTRDHSTNLWWVALLTYGEGWHNNHHAYPDFGPPRAAMVGDRHDLSRHLADEAVSDRLQHPAW